MPRAMTQDEADAAAIEQLATAFADLCEGQATGIVLSAVVVLVSAVIERLPAAAQVVATATLKQAIHDPLADMPVAGRA